MNGPFLENCLPLGTLNKYIIKNFKTASPTDIGGKKEEGSRPEELLMLFAPF